MKDYNDKIYNKRDENGNIITGPKNFLTNPTKQGQGNTTIGHLFNHVNYENDPYNREKEMDKNERAIHKSKILDLKKPFINSKHGQGIFNPDRIVYGLDRPITEGIKRTYNYPGVQHPKAFKNADIPKKGYNKTIQKFPFYSEEGDVPRAWKKTIPSMTQRAWIFHTRGTLSKPCPSIVSMSLNKNKISQFRR
ncbi:hypothetical protein IMG5_127650 [Ichthyophthirius multifiliis]|uniref:Cilia-and flagella-associated protein 96 n=1 Tax=Ichthyophthirius multifiliis TaxID=5932 RepID=G0QVX9_ICHMU|nr:hypothetical protein IMG5_127650 [Ichthyophthirius multifiliis]EGR30625.1 hypothetical protein IMG5_127650 [Ichthyophthirius multifiliis]|eukprot:XP_004032212.1 hypothetical protein IMG5_127650 [Ichthyophthirius multifiliis]